MGEGEGRRREEQGDEGRGGDSLGGGQGPNDDQQAPPRQAGWWRESRGRWREQQSDASRRVTARMVVRAGKAIARPRPDRRE
ncbi:hypothetical protein GCM10023259_024100 [Thermocatellispora tengchongensis]